MYICVYILRFILRFNLHSRKVRSSEELFADDRGKLIRT